MEYIFEHFEIMFWSSAKPRNVKAMIKQVTSPEQRGRVLAMWGRDRFGLMKLDYSAELVTIKSLHRVWRDKKMGGKKRRWGVENTVLLDSSVLKAVYQPYNHIRVPEFVGIDRWEGDVALREVVGHLEAMRYQGDIVQPHKVDFYFDRRIRVATGCAVPLFAL
jgi:NLI interacting factor-like phosphatase